MDKDFLKQLNEFEKAVTEGLNEILLHYIINITGIKDRSPINQHPTFWVYCLHNCLNMAIIVLGRIFDSDSNTKYTVYKLLIQIKNNLNIFSKKSLEKRKKEIFKSKEEIESYLEDKKEFSKKDLDRIEKRIKKLEIIYEKVYKKIRNRMIAHKEVTKFEEIKNYDAKFGYRKILLIYITLYNINREVREAYHNGNTYSEKLTIRKINDLIDNDFKTYSGTPEYTYIMRDFKDIYDMVKRVRFKK